MTLPRLMLVTDRHRCPPAELVTRVAQACQGGVRLVQVREKDLGASDLEALVLAIRDAIPPDTVILVNDAPELAHKLGCGLHLPAGAAPAQASHAEPYGRSAHDEGEAKAALEDGVGYLVVGPVYATPSKPGHPGHGVEFVHRLAGIAGDVPVYTIGGVNTYRIAELVAAGAYGVAVCGAILGAGDVRAVAAAMTLALLHSADRVQLEDMRW